MKLDRRPDRELRDAGIPVKPRPPDMGLEGGLFPRPIPRARPKLLEVGGPKGACELEVAGP